VIIVQDTREKQPWQFAEGQTVEKLDAGDYALQHSFSIIIERKKGISELARNLGFKRPQFEAELEKMEPYEQRYVICEFSYEAMLKYPKGERIPRKLKRKIKMNGPYMATVISTLEEQYGVEFIFCEDRQTAKNQAEELLSAASNTT